jgi:hypothetical protein
MSEQYQVFVLIPNGIFGEKAVYETHSILEKMGGVLDEDSILMLNDTQNDSPEPEYITDAFEALATLADWQTGGAIAYSMPEFMITVGYKGLPDTHLVQVIKISMMERAFEKGGDEIKNRYVQLAQQLHENFQARRTIMDWGIEYNGFCWDEEIERLKKGELVGEYFLDIRADKPAPKQKLVA